MIYMFRLGPDGPVKIGVSDAPYHRICSILSCFPQQPVILAIMPGDLAEETRLHEMFEQHRLRGEWFSPADEILDYARQHTEPFLSIAEGRAKENAAKHPPRAPVEINKSFPAPGSIKAVVAAVGVSRKTIHRWVALGYVTPTKIPEKVSGIGYLLEFSEADIEKMRSLKLKPGRKKKPRPTPLFSE